jgi:hypothetical protein
LEVRQKLTYELIAMHESKFTIEMVEVEEEE